MARFDVPAILGRPEYFDLSGFKPKNIGKVLVTGAAGSVGQALKYRLPAAIMTDIVQPCDELLNVRYLDSLTEAISRHKPTTIIHLAAGKHAPLGELSPSAYAAVNIDGTHHVLVAANGTSVKRVVVASTCKACDPETVYGATKLIAERMALKERYSVARFHNVIESSGNVFETWREQLEKGERLQYTNCTRRFLSMGEAVGLLLYVADWETNWGRYSVQPTFPVNMEDVLSTVHPKELTTEMERRPGDRHDEPTRAVSEIFQTTDLKGVCRITSPHDPV